MEKTMNNSQIIDSLDGSEIAIIGMSCRVPGAKNIKEFWRNLKEGKESITYFTDEELLKAGVNSSYLKDPNFVKVGSILEDYDKFDAEFFGYSPQEAELMDPQQRVYIECAWEAFEDAGYNPETYKGEIGTFSGSKTDTYLLNIAAIPNYLNSMDSIQIALGNDLGCLSTRLAYKFNLRGPSCAVHTACSTSLVAVHLACQSLLIDECQMAVAGGVTINVPHKTGYFYQPGGVASSDGHCRAFDADADGTVFGNGVGAVILKRLEDAIRDGDHVYAVIKGSAVNNDGSQKASYTAPGVEGQTKVVMAALASAGIDADTISYIEAHGTGTNLGDPIEITALTNAFRASTDKSGYCAVGSVKTNIGHLDSASGIASLIKTALSINSKMIPPSLNYNKPNPKIDFDSSPFYVNDKLVEWKPDNMPIRAGVSSFGFGSTNAHVVLEEAPVVEESEDSGLYKLLLLSARSENALEESAAGLAEYLKQNPDCNLADVEYTLKVGRKVFSHRKMVVCKDSDDAVKVLENPDSQDAFTDYEERSDKQVIFMFPGQGAQYIDMAKEIYTSEPDFKREVDNCAEIIKPYLGMDIRSILYPENQERETAANELNQTYITQPVLFIIEYSLAKLFMKWGIKPQAMIGHSIGEYVAACLSGVLSLEDALLLVVKRGKLMQSLPGGAMLSVCLSEKEIQSYINEKISIATINSPDLIVVSGTYESIDDLQKKLEEKNIQCRRLHTSHAFHSYMMEPILDEFSETLKGITFNKPNIPYVSNVTGNFIEDSDVANVQYWTKHLRSAVRFSDGIRELLNQSSKVFLEVGPGQTLSTFVRKNESEDGDSNTILNSLRHPKDQRSDMAFLMSALGKLWVGGAKINWNKYYKNKYQKRVSLPTYPFERQRYWIEELDAITAAGPENKITLDKISNVSEWFYEPVWNKSELTGQIHKQDLSDTSTGYLVFEDDCGVGKEMAEYLTKQSGYVIKVKAGEQFSQISESEFIVNPQQLSDFEQLMKKAADANKTQLKIVHFWTVTDDSDGLAPGTIELHQKMGYDSLISLAQAIGNNKSVSTADIIIVSSNMQKVSGKEKLQPGKATLLGPCRVIPKEYPNVSARSIDVVLPESEKEIGQLVEAIVYEVSSRYEDLKKNTTVAYRDGSRYVYEAKAFIQEKALDENKGLPDRIRKNGVYLITGGLGGVGFVLAEHLAKVAQAKLILTGRSELPTRDNWDIWLSEHNDKDSVSVKIKKIQALEALGSQVIVTSVDVTDKEKMCMAISDAEAVFGKINGIIHAAGIAGGGMIQQKTLKTTADVFGPKIKGVLALFNTICGEEIDFVVLCSSLQSLMGDLGQADYCAANAFLDAFADYCIVKGLDTVTAVGWDNWQEVGIAADTQVPDAMKALRQEVLSKAISSEEGIDVFERTLLSKKEKVIISAQLLPERIELSNSFTQDDLMGTPKNTGLYTDNKRTQVKSNLSKNDIQNKVADIWKKVLGVKKVGVNDNFFDLGGNSLSALQLVGEIKRVFDIQMTPVAIYEAPTVGTMAKYLGQDAGEEQKEEQNREAANVSPEAGSDENSEIAIVGMSCRFPGAKNIDEFWENLCGGIEAIKPLSDDELIQAGVDPKLLKNPNYIKAASTVDGYDMFDAEFFGYTPREAEMMDPQHRLFLQCAWESLENAGYTQDKYKGLIGVFAGASLSTYMFNLYSNTKLMESVGSLAAIIGNDKDSLTTAVSYKLNLKGPSMAVQTFCSTSLVAVHLASKSLLSGECDMALAGGATINVPHKNGYMYNEGGIFSSDGHCRAFDQDANGMIFGNGVGIIALKRLKDALADGDSIIAVVKGSAVNNDGSLKVGYTAPSVDGQSEVISNALKNAGVDAGSIGYIEAHGTGTAMGDPIEIAALTKAFRETTENSGYCAIGSVKSNLGHLDRAAGIAGLIKAALSVKNGMIPPSLNYSKPNPKIDFENSPFFVNTALRKWDSTDTPRRAGISALGFGGTNAHIILEEPPIVQSSDNSRPCQLLLLSGRTPNALNANINSLYEYLKENNSIDLADCAYTLQVGRKDFKYRKAIVCTDMEDALHVLGGEEPKRILAGEYENDNKAVVFMFPGQGSQYPDMGLELYKNETVFREQVDYCSEVLKKHLDLDLRSILYPQNDEDKKNAADILSQTKYTQPAVFVIEYAMAKLLCSWGIEPDAMIGHSIGEYVAAVLAGVITLDDALMLVSARGRMIQELPGGTMLSIPLTADEITPHLENSLSMAAVNSPDQCVVSGTNEDIGKLKAVLSEKGVESRELHTSHAFHSVMMEPILEPFKALVSGIELKTPQIPYISCVTGTWITENEAVNPAYWASHLRGTVLFAAGIGEILKDKSNILLEAGPGQTLSKLARSCNKDGDERCIISTIRHPNDKITDMAFLLTGLGKLWIAGKQPEWKDFYKQEKRLRIPLPTYSFECKRYWIDKAESQDVKAAQLKTDVNDWILIPSWKRSNLLDTIKPNSFEKNDSKWLIFIEPYGIGQQIAERLLAEGQEVITVTAGDGFKALDSHTFIMNPERAWEYAALINKLNDIEMLPDIIIHLWNYSGKTGCGDSIEYFKKSRISGAYSVLSLAQSISKFSDNKNIDMWIISDSTADVNGEEILQPEKTISVGMCRTINAGASNVACHSIDILPDKQANKTGDSILAEIFSGHQEAEVAFRGKYRWIPDFEEYISKENEVYDFKENGTYLVMDALIGEGFDFASYLAQSANAKLVLPQPYEIPDRKEWDSILAQDAFGIGSQPIYSGSEKESAAIDYIWSQYTGTADTENMPQGFESRLDKLCTAYIYNYFAQGINIENDKPYEKADLIKKIGVSDHFAKFFNFMLSVLEQDGVIEITDKTVTFKKSLDESCKPELLAADLLKEFPEFENALNALKHCVDKYSDVLAGKVSSMNVFSLDSGCNVLEAVDEAQRKFSNGIQLQKVISEYVGKLSSTESGRKIRILEINTGDDRLTWSIADVLKDKDIEYYFTSASKSIVNATEKIAAQNGFGFMKFGLLDITNNPEKQGFNPYGYDIVIGTNTVHAQPDIANAVQNITKLLIPDGLMILMEATKPQRWVNMIWGLADYWWNYSDDNLRSNSPLLTPLTWENVLKEQGLTGVKIYPDANGNETADHSLIVVEQKNLLDSDDYKNWLIESQKEQNLSIKQRIEKIKQLELLGAEVFTPFVADNSENSMAAAIQSAQNLFGRILGAIYIPYSIKPGSDIELCQKNFETNVNTLNSLDTILTEVNPDFAVLMSCGEFNPQGCNDYFTGPMSSYMDGFVQGSEYSSLSWKLIRWDNWKKKFEDDGYISPEDAVSAFSYIITKEDISQIIVSPRSISQISDECKWPHYKQLNNEAEIQNIDHVNDRPDIDSSYMPAQNDIEQRIMKVWQDVLGISKIGINDSFFEIGGDSLQATQLNSRIRDQFGVDLPMQTFFNAPTIGETAAAIEDMKQSEEKEAEAEILKMLEQLSEDEIDEALSKMKNL
jgi:acyl transferase domain-containing protein/acyl carrier protein